jgi:hypothetical protein
MYRHNKIKVDIWLTLHVFLVTKKQPNCQIGRLNSYTSYLLEILGSDCLDQSSGHDMFL